MEKHTELVSDNGLVFKDMIKSDRLVLLTTSDSRLAVYSPNGKLVTMLSAAQLGGKANPQSLTVSTDSQTLFFLDATKNLHALDLAQKEKATPQLLHKELKTSELASVNNELYFVNGDKLMVLAKQGATYAESKKKLNFPPTWKPVSAETQLSVVGPSHLLVRDSADHFGVFDTNTGELIEHTDHVNAGKPPQFDKGHQASFKPALNSLFGVHRGAVVQFAYQVGAVITRFEPGEFGTIQTFGISGNKLYLMTEHHYMVFLIPAIDHKDRNPPLVTVIKLKFPANNPLSKVFHNGEDLLHLIFVAGTKVDTVRISPDWDKFEPVVLNTGGKARAPQQQYEGHSQEEYMGQSDEEGYPGPAGQRGTKTKKKKVVKKRKRSFDLGGMQHMKASEYNALKDEHLKSYFYCDRIRKHLQKQHLITRDGYIIENPEEYRKNQKLLKEHYRSQEPKKTAKKKVHGKAPRQADQGYDEEAYQSKTHTNRPGDAERVKKDDFREFLNDVEQVAGGQSKAGAKQHESQKSATELGSEKAIAEAKAKAEREASAKAHAEKDALAKAQSEKDAAAKAKAEKDAAAKAQAEKDAAAKAQAEKDAAKTKEAANKDAAAKAQPQAQTTPANPPKPAEQKEPVQPAAPKPAVMPEKPQTLDNEF